MNKQVDKIQMPEKESGVTNYPMVKTYRKTSCECSETVNTRLRFANTFTTHMDINTYLVIFFLHATRASWQINAGKPFDCNIVFQFSEFSHDFVNIIIFRNTFDFGSRRQRMAKRRSHFN